MAVGLNKNGRTVKTIIYTKIKYILNKKYRNRLLICFVYLKEKIVKIYKSIINHLLFIKKNLSI